MIHTSNFKFLKYNNMGQLNYKCNKVECAVMGAYNFITNLPIFSLHTSEAQKGQNVYI